MHFMSVYDCKLEQYHFPKIIIIMTQESMQRFKPQSNPFWEKSNPIRKKREEREKKCREQWTLVLVYNDKDSTLTSVEPIINMLTSSVLGVCPVEGGQCLSTFIKPKKQTLKDKPLAWPLLLIYKLYKGKYSIGTFSLKISHDPVKIRGKSII